MVRLPTERAVIEKMAYVLANPVKAGLVQRAAHWPGVTVLPQELGRRTWKVQRPDFYFDARTWPDEVELTLTVATGAPGTLHRRANPGCGRARTHPPRADSRKPR